MSSVLKLPTNRLFWLIHSVEQRAATVVPSSSNDETVDFQPLLIKKSIIDDQGFYQCAFKKPGAQERLVLSNQANVQFNGKCYTLIQR